MSPSRKPSRESGRVEAFTDGVFAIAITLLVLDLPVPPPGGFGETLAADWPSYLAYLAAFLTIAGIWVHHHTFFGRILRVEPVVLLLNLLLLLGVSLLPWPTSLIAVAIRDGSPADGVVACSIFSLAALIVMTAWSTLGRVVVHRPHLLVDSDSVRWMQANSREATLAGIPVVVGVAVAFISPVISLAVYIAIPIYFLVSTSRALPDTETAD